MLYNNPFEQPGQLNTHSHIVELHHAIDTLASLSPSDARDVWHVIASSRIARVDVAVYAIATLKAHSE